MLKTLGRPYVFKLLYNNNNCALFSSKTQLPGFGLTNVKKKVGDANIKVTLISPNEELSIVSLAEAEKISKRRELKLVKIIDFDTKTKRPVYRLMSSQEYLEKELQRRADKKEAKKEISIKGEKLAPFSSNIAQHDLETQLRKISKWLQKFFEVRVIINVDGKNPNSDKIFLQIQTATAELGAIKQKHVNNGQYKFQIVPFLNAADKTSDNIPNSSTADQTSEKLKNEMNSEIDSADSPITDDDNDSNTNKEISIKS